jgi:hypothetical protein
MGEEGAVEPFKGQEMPRPLTLQGIQGLPWLLGCWLAGQVDLSHKNGSVSLSLPGSLPHPGVLALPAEIAPFPVTAASLALLV